MCFSSCKNRKLKAKLWWVGARERKRGHFLYRLFCLKEDFLRFVFYHNVKCIEYTFRVLILLHVKKYYINYITFSCLFLKLSKTFSVSLKGNVRWIKKEIQNLKILMEMEKHIRKSKFYQIINLRNLELCLISKYLNSKLLLVK